MRRQLENKQLVLLVISIMAVSGANAFAPSMPNSVRNVVPCRGDLTRRFVGTKWPLPLTNDTSSAMIRATDFVDPSTMLSSLLSSSSSKEATAQKSIDSSRRDLVKLSDDEVTTSTTTNNNNYLVPVAGAMAALLLVAASLSGDL